MFPCTNMLQKVFWKFHCTDARVTTRGARWLFAHNALLGIDPKNMGSRDPAFKWVDMNANRWGSAPRGRGRGDVPNTDTHPVCVPPAVRSFQTLTFDMDMEKHAAAGNNVMLSNYGIYGTVAHYNRDPVCWALQPTPAMQAETMDWYRGVFFAGLPPTYTWSAHTRVVSVHVRRGDFLKSNSKGVLSRESSAEAWAMLLCAALGHTCLFPPCVCVSLTWVFVNKGPGAEIGAGVGAGPGRGRVLRRGPRFC